MITFKLAKKKLSKALGGVSCVSGSVSDIASAIGILGVKSGEPSVTSVGVITSVFAKAVKGASSLIKHLAEKEGSVEQARDLDLMYHLVCQEAFFSVLKEHIENTPYDHSSSISSESLIIQGQSLTEINTSLQGGYIALTNDGSLFAAYTARVRSLLRAIYPNHLKIDDEVEDVMNAATDLVRRSIAQQPSLHAHFEMESHVDTQQRIQALQNSLEDKELKVSGTSQSATVAAREDPLPSLSATNVQDAETKLAEVYRILTISPNEGSAATAELESISESIRGQFDAARKHLEAGDLVKAETEFRVVIQLLQHSSESENVKLKARSISNLGLIFYRRGKLRSARRYFLLSYKLCPEYPNIRSLRALALDIEGKSDEAIDFLSKEISAGDPYLGSQQLYVQILANRGESKKALEYLDTIGVEDRGWVEIRARILLESGQFAEARLILEEAIRDCATVDMKEQLAYCLAYPLVDTHREQIVSLQQAEEDDLDRAILLLQEARGGYKGQRNREAELQVLINISAFQTRRGRLKDARHTLNTAIEGSPGSIVALENRFVVLQKLGLHEEARIDAGLLFSLNRSLEYAIRFTEALLCLDRFRPALKFITECEETLPEAKEHLVLQCYKLQALHARHERKQAETQADLLVSKSAESAFALYILGRYYSDLRNDNKAEELFVAAIECANGSEKVSITNDYGLHFYHRSNWSKAVELLTKYNNDPLNSPFFGEILNCFYQLRDFQKVLLLCENANEADLEPLALNVLANTLIVLSEFGKAAEALECLIDCTRRSSYRVTLAQVYHRLGKLERSEDLLRDAFNDDPKNLTTLIQLSRVAYQLGICQQGFNYGLKAYELDSTSVDAMSCVFQVTMQNSGEVELEEYELNILQECREKHPGIKKIKIEEDESGKIDPTPIFEMAREQGERAAKIVSAYKESRAPLLSLVEALGYDYWAAWRGMTNQKDGKIFMSSGSFDEQIYQNHTALEATEVVMDTTSILTAHGLGLLGLAANSFEKIFVPILTVDDLRESLNRLKQLSSGSEGGTLIPVEDRFILVEHSPEEIQSEIEQIESILSFLNRAPVEIVGIDPAYLSKRENDESWKRLPESAFFSFSISHSRNAPLWSDQMAILQIHRGLEDGNGFCSRAFLERTRLKGVLCRDKLDDALLWLMEHNYTFVAEHASTLARQAKRTGYALTEFGRFLISRIGDQSWNNETSAKIYGASFAKLWLACPIELRTDWVKGVVVALENDLTTGRVLIGFVSGVIMELRNNPAGYFGILDAIIESSNTSPKLGLEIRGLLVATSEFVNRSRKFRRLLDPGSLVQWRKQMRMQNLLGSLRA